MNNPVKIVITLPAEEFQLPQDLERIHSAVVDALAKLSDEPAGESSPAHEEDIAEHICETLDSIHNIARECRLLLEDGLDTMEDLVELLDNGAGPCDR